MKSTTTTRFVDTLEDVLNNWYAMHYGVEREGKDLSALDINMFNKAVYDFAFLHFCKEDKAVMREAWRGDQDEGC